MTAMCQALPSATLSLISGRVLLYWCEALILEAFLFSKEVAWHSANRPYSEARRLVSRVAPD